MRTLKLPRSPYRSIRPFAQNESMVRQANERAAIEECERETYCARELAGDGIFMHRPTTRARTEPGVIEFCHVVRQTRRETAVGPISSSWRHRRAATVPTIRVSEPGESDALVSESSTHHSSSSSIPAAHTRARAQLKPLRGPPSEWALTSVLGSPDDESTVYHTHFNESNLRHNLKYKHQSQANRAQGLGKNRTSMSDWLAAIGAGSNSLVADDVAAKAGPVLRASPMLSGVCTPRFSPTYSTSDSSGPTTPIEGLYLPRSVIEDMREIGTSGGRRSRARCSYLGQGHEDVVAPMIPEELWTDEIGVAC
ncbi:hypothetical protein BN14_10757 [Rhizoctonia solani AG-1 IB]|uniref:Uncharacterized protein n=1 Tax=Thanatephorus cucumeris (strain AG1-IB / isolate 7/3/14) TaxID=1108050 RepID=M5CC22_THACB|nr:hypothetical protein BN14_10757 [Rhizoctonia solani AG-1 IB]